MKITSFTKLVATTVCYSVLASSSFAAEMSSDDKKIYFGIEGGYSVAAKHKFKEKTDDGIVIGKLKGTEVFEGKIGYKFYPGFSVEFAYGLRPKYKLNIWLPDKPNAIAPGVGTSNTISTTHVKSHTAMLNLIYEAQSEKKYRPYFLFGVGYANVTPKRSPIFADITAAGISHKQIGSVKKFTSQRLGWRVGAGVILDVTPNVALVGGAKLEVINNIGLHTEYYDGNGKVNKLASLKKTIGVVDFTIGTRISL
jgi:opacity protein-like surface antigen